MDQEGFITGTSLKPLEKNKLLAMHFSPCLSHFLIRLAIPLFLSRCSFNADCQVLPLQYYTTREGLIANHITALCQNSLGYLWIGTADGVSVYDGANFTNYTTVNGLAHNFVTCIAESKRTPGTMWVGTFRGGISEFQDGRFTTVSVASVDSMNNVVALLEDAHGVLWCGTSNGLSVIRNGQVIPLGTPRKMGSISFAQLNDDEICVATDNVLSIYSASTTLLRSSMTASMSGKPIMGMLVDDDGSFWLAVSDSTILHMRDTTCLARMKLDCGVLSDIVDDHRGHLICSSWNGVIEVSKALFPAGHCITYSVANGLREMIALPILVDREKDLWIGSWSKGLAKLPSPALISLPNPDGERSFMSVTDSAGHLWTATNRGLWEAFRDADGRWNQHLHHRVRADESLQPSTHFIVCDSRNRLWERTGEPPVVRCFEISHTLGGPSTLRTIQTLSSGIDFPRGQLVTFTVDRQNRFWGSIPSVGVVEFDCQGSGGKRILTVRDGLPSESIPVLFEDLRGRMWFGGFDGGLVVLSHDPSGRENLRRFLKSDGLPDNCIRSMLQDRDGNIWVGTRYGGLALLRDSTFTSLSLADGLLNNAIWDMAQDQRGRIWLGTDIGMDCIDPRTRRPVRRNNDFLGEHIYSCGVIRGTTMWYVTRAGLTLYENSLDSANDVPPPIYVTGFLVNGREVRRNTPWEFSHDENDCQFDFVGISLKDEKAVRYEYRLRNVDEEWHTSSQRSVTFAALRPGSYVFEVRAINNDDVRSVSPASVSFVITPPYWQRTWFIATLIVLSLSLLYAIYRYRVQRVLEIERLRLRIASDLHDDVGTNLSSIVLASQIMERKFPLSVDERKELSQVRSTASQTQDLMRDIVWMLNPQNDSLDDFLRKMKEVAGRLLAGIPHTFNAPKEQRLDRLGLEFKRSVLLIFKETLNNIVRHSLATHVSIEVLDEEGVFSLFVQDNGIGFEPGTAKTTGSGLESLRRRAEGIGGTLTIVSSVGEGTAVRFSARIT